MSNWPTLFVKVKLLTKTAQLPVYSSDGAAGADVFADLLPQAYEPKWGPFQPEMIANNLPKLLAEKHGDTAVAMMLPGHHYAIPTGIAMEIPEGWHGQLKDRSGMAARGQVTHVGVLDPDYRGGVHVIVRCHEPMIVAHGDRIGQLLFIPTGRANLTLVDELTETARGANGLGSTGR